MSSKAFTDTSKFLSYVLRHAPESIDLQLDSDGWGDVDEAKRIIVECVERAKKTGF